MPQHQQLEPWGGELHLPRPIRWLLRRPAPVGDTPERAHERHTPAQDLTTPLENVDRAILGAFSDSHPSNRRH